MHNRQIHKATILKGGIRKNNQAPYIVKGFRLWDKVRYDGQECFISGRRATGYFISKEVRWHDYYQQYIIQKVAVVRNR